MFKESIIRTRLFKDKSNFSFFNESNIFLCSLFIIVFYSSLSKMSAFEDVSSSFPVLIEAPTLVIGGVGELSFIKNQACRLHFNFTIKP